jgi:hypothetical protein
VVGACGWQANVADRDAEHRVPADRCARKIVGFLKVIGSALAAAELFRWAGAKNTSPNAVPAMLHSPHGAPERTSSPNDQLVVWRSHSDFTGVVSYACSGVTDNVAPNGGFAEACILRAGFSERITP